MNVTAEELIYHIVMNMSSPYDFCTIVDGNERYDNYRQNSAIPSHILKKKVKSIALQRLFCTQYGIRPYGDDEFDEVIPTLEIYV